MNYQEIANHVWHNGKILPKEEITQIFDFNFLFHSNLNEYFFTSGTDILFFNETLSCIQNHLKIYNINSVLFSDFTGETFKNEIKRLIIRNKFYKTARCNILLTPNFEKNILNEFIFVIPDLQLFSTDKIIKKTFVSKLFLKPLGAAMNLPTMENEFRKIIKTEIEFEKGEDCIILNHNQNITESFLGNIFLIEHGRVLTPSLSSGCNPLLLRNIIINIFFQLKFEIVEKSDLQIEHLFSSDEVIIAGITGIYSLKGIEYKRYFDNTRKILISKIIEASRD